MKNLIVLFITSHIIKPAPIEAGLTIKESILFLQ